ncbi:TPA: DUF1833 family protein [Stenotrophomonas maltophilia]
MPRILSPAAARAVVAAETDELLLCLLTITHPDLQTIRIVNNTEPVARGSTVWQPYPFEASFPDDTDDATPNVSLRIDNVDRDITRQIKALQGPRPQVRLEAVLASQPGTVEMGPFNFTVLQVDFDIMELSVQIGYQEDFLNQGVPAQTYTPSNSPGLFV